MIAVLRELAADDSGGAMIEYALVFALVSMIGLTALEGFGTVLHDFFKTSSFGLADVAQLAQ
jgi:Flp pilus assembly pilin Flp